MMSLEEQSRADAKRAADLKFMDLLRGFGFVGSGPGRYEREHGRRVEHKANARRRRHRQAARAQRTTPRRVAKAARRGRSWAVNALAQVDAA